MLWTQRFTHSGGAGTLVRVAGPGVSLAPAGEVPSPASLSYGSVLPCAPNIETGNDTDVASFATQPSIGMVTALVIPCEASSARNCVYGLVSLFSKNQSASRFQAEISQLYRDVLFPPQRRAVAPSAHWDGDSSSRGRYPMP